MSYSETSYQVWIRSQLEPEEVIKGGRNIPSTPAWVAKNKSIQLLQQEMGLEAYKRMIEEDAAKAREWYEYENNI